MFMLKSCVLTFGKNVLLPPSSDQKRVKMDVTHSFETLVHFFKFNGIPSEVFVAIIMRSSCLTLSSQKYGEFGMTAL
jgi:hypothetical protein